MKTASEYRTEFIDKCTEVIEDGENTVLYFKWYVYQECFKELIEAIRQEQLKEINLLIDHYCKLLSVHGRDYSALVTSAYQDREAYEAFQETITRAEKKVTQAARQTLGGNTDAAMAQLLEETINAVRLAEIDKIFNSNNQQSHAQ